jgi:hypothetical protein
MSVIEVVERKSRYRAASFYFFATMSLVTLWLSMNRPQSDFLRGLWLGLTFAAAANLLPLARWLKPRSDVARLLDDDGVREHRRMSCTTGFWAAVLSSLAVATVVEFAAPLGAFDAVRIVATAAVAAALTSFATLELRAARG